MQLIKGMVPQFVFYRSNLVFWIVVGCGGQGPTGRCFQLRDGSGSGIGKNFGFGYVSGWGIGTAFFSIGYYQVLKILIGYLSVTSLIRYFLLVQLRSSQPLRPLDPSACLALMKFWDAVLVDQ